MEAMQSISISTTEVSEKEYLDLSYRYWYLSSKIEINVLTFLYIEVYVSRLIC